MKKVILKPKKDAAVRRFHPWVFSGAIGKMDNNIADGETVEVYSAGNEYLATGHYQSGASISVRLFAFNKTDADQAFWTQQIRNAYQFRETLGLTKHPYTNCYRLIHAEGDGMPGLIIDIYHKTAVLQCHSIGMHLQKDQLTQALVEVYGGDLQVIYDKSADTLPAPYAANMQNSYLYSSNQPLNVSTLQSDHFALENGHRFKIDWETGQKTGFFLDQRENRALLAHYARGKTVLNTFCYTGGFSVYALKADATFVESVDVSAKAMELTDQNVLLNAPDPTLHRSHTQDVLKFLQQTENEYEVMIVDPPAFAKSLAKRHNAVQGYKRLNALAMQKVKKGGILFTFSCSQVVDPQLFYDTIVAAALEAGRTARVMHHLSQPADHPVSLYHPEGAYLKGLVLYVE
ncbi:MAG: class I SAM-dependent rRNA methyltransferase [Saprospiraceae bacterium]